VAIPSGIYITVDHGTVGPAVVTLLAAEDADDPHHVGTVALLRTGTLATLDPALYEIKTSPELRWRDPARRCLYASASVGSDHRLPWQLDTVVRSPGRLSLGNGRSDRPRALLLLHHEHQGRAADGPAARGKEQRSDARDALTRLPLADKRGHQIRADRVAETGAGSAVDPVLARERSGELREPLDIKAQAARVARQGERCPPRGGPARSDLSGRPGALRRRAPLGTGLASLPASGSSKPLGSGGVRPYDPFNVEWIVLGSVHRDRGRGV
jgi:hypothetical protein